MLPGGYPVDNTTTPNDSLARVNGSGHKIGPAIVLKVMSGDVIDIGVKSFYRPQGSAGGTSDPLTDILGVLANGIVTAAGESKGTLTELSNINTSPLVTALNNFRNTENPDQPGKPKAYLNWILLDEQFVFTAASSGALEVGNPDEIVPLGELGIEMTKSGYLYIYVSNETQNWDSLSR